MQSSIRHFKTYIVLLLTAITALIWVAVFYVDVTQHLTITFFDVGQGDAIFIEAPNGNQMLIDGGPTDKVLASLGRAMPFWDRSIDVLVLTHPDKDHLTGLVEVLRRYDIGTVLWTGVDHSSAEYQEWLRALDDRGVPEVIARAGQQLYLDDDVTYDVLVPFERVADATSTKVNNTSVVGTLRYGENSLLLTGDIERAVEYRMLFETPSNFLDVDILKVAHHGSKTSSIEEFLGVVSPEIAVIQVGRENRYGHPSQEVLDRIVGLGIKILRTDTEGDIVFKSDGTHFWRK